MLSEKTHVRKEKNPVLSPPSLACLFKRKIPPGLRTYFHSLRRQPDWSPLTSEQTGREGQQTEQSHLSRNEPVSVTNLFHFLPPSLLCLPVFARPPEPAAYRRTLVEWGYCHHNYVAVTYVQKCMTNWLTTFLSFFPSVVWCHVLAAKAAFISRPFAGYCYNIKPFLSELHSRVLFSFCLKPKCNTNICALQAAQKQPLKE